MLKVNMHHVKHIQSGLIVNAKTFISVCINMLPQWNSVNKSYGAIYVTFI